MPEDGEAIGRRTSYPVSGEAGRRASRGEETPSISNETLCATGELLHRPEWQLARRIAASKTLSRSEYLPNFLLYVCAQQLTCHGQEITEQRIGVEVFRRPPGYNPGEDNIVRNYARLLRKRLRQYFDSESPEEAMRVEIPRGGYVPIFRTAPRTEAAEEPKPEEEAPAAELAEHSSGDGPAASAEKGSRRWRPSFYRYAAVLAGFVLGLVLWPSGWMLTHPALPRREPSATHALWTQLFQADRNAVLVPSDSGLGILQNLTGTVVSLSNYASGTYLSNENAREAMTPESLRDLRNQRYTSVVSLEVAFSLAQLPEFIPNRLQIRAARELSPEDFKTSNVILLGSMHSNPWVELFQKNLNFPLEYTTKVDQSYVLNRSPQGAEKKIYNNGDGNQDNETYGVIDYLPNLSGSGHVLIIQGLNMAATQAAAEILLDRKAMRSVMSQVARPDGSLGAFELLVETSSIGGAAPSARIIASRFYN
jgi:hypothetical protein